jgi:hypothetical protein
MRPTAAIRRSPNRTAEEAPHRPWLVGNLDAFTAFGRCDRRIVSRTLVVETADHTFASTTTIQTLCDRRAHGLAPRSA